MELRWDDVRYFLAACEEGSFSAAARALSVEQSTVSRRIAALEGGLGGALFVRGRGGLVLTERGAQIAPLARDARRAMLELVDASAQEIEGVVRVAMTEGMAAHGFIQALPELYARHPGLRVQLVTGFGVSDLSRREADIAIRFTRPTHADLVFRQLTTFEYTVWGAPRWAGLHADQLEWVGLDLGPIPTPSVERDPTLAPPALTTDSYISLVAALRHGLGVAVLPRLLGSASPGLVEIEVPHELPPPLPLYLVGHTANRRTPRVAAAWSFIEEWAARELARRQIDPRPRPDTPSGH